VGKGKLKYTMVMNARSSPTQCIMKEEQVFAQLTISLKTKFVSL